MIIKYLSCDGETEVLEGIVNVEFCEYENRITGEIVQGMECTRTREDTFVVDCKDVFYITKRRCIEDGYLEGEDEDEI